MEADLDPGFGPVYLRLEADATANLRATLARRHRPVDEPATGDRPSDAVRLGVATERLDAKTLCAMQRRMLSGRNRRFPLGLRRDVVWLSAGRLRSPQGAAFIPPHPRHLPALLDDLALFLDRDDLDPLLRATIGLGQLLSVHPFADGNGRTARLLFQALLRRYGLVDRVAPPVGTVMNLAQDRLRHALMSGYQAGHPAPWCSYVLRAVLAASESCANARSGVGGVPNSYGDPRRAGRREPIQEAPS